MYYTDFGHFIVYSYILGVLGGLMLSAFIIYRYRRTKDGNIHNRHSFNIHNFSIKHFSRNLYKRLFR